MNILVLFLCLFLSSCALLKKSPDVLSSFSSCTNLNAIATWELSGALAIKNKDRVWSALLYWQQHDVNHYRMQLFGPLGSGAVAIEKAGKLFRYQDNQRQIITTNGEALIEQYIAIRVPLEMLFYWVRGLPGPGEVQHIEYNQDHALANLQQAGYTVHYLSYMREKQFDLPRKMHLTGNGMDIKLIIKHWKFACKKRS